jgi:hypothetical protein
MVFWRFGTAPLFGVPFRSARSRLNFFGPKHSESAFLEESFVGRKKSAPPRLGEPIFELRMGKAKDSCAWNHLLPRRGFAGSGANIIQRVDAPEIATLVDHVPN